MPSRTLLANAIYFGQLSIIITCHCSTVIHYDDHIRVYRIATAGMALQEAEKLITGNYSSMVIDTESWNLKKENEIAEGEALTSCGKSALPISIL